MTELFLKEKMNPLYRAWYAVWVYWWPMWRALYSRQAIQRKWQQFDLIEEGQYFLDYGCGTGCFSLPAAKIVGEKGKVYALDYLPRQLHIVEQRARKAGLNNIHTILSECVTGLPDEYIDTVWMCDVLHEISQKQAVLKELHRVLKRKGTLAIYDGMRDRLLKHTSGLFSLKEKEDKLLKFTKY